MEEKGIKTNFVYLHHDPDPSFPNGIPNPMLEENRSATADVVISEEADFGVAFDGDFDRCFLFDQDGNFIPGEYLLGLLSTVFLRKEKGATIVHDPRVIWNTIDIVNKCDGIAVSSKTGHSFVKAAMRENSAIYGGEISAHHYFRDFAYCDSGMIPWLMIWELISKSNLSLSELISERKQLFPSSGEINFTVADPENCLEMVNSLFVSEATSVDELDGLSMCFEKWRFNLRKSNTEPYVRLNVETRGDDMLFCVVIILSSGYGFSRRGVFDEIAIQSAHSGFVPRVGGLAIYMSVLVLIPLLSFGFIPLSVVFNLNAAQITWLILSAVPVFSIGLAEDIGYAMSSKARLIASAISSLLVILIFKTWLTRLGVPGIDMLLNFAPFAIFFTVFATVGVVNAFNLIDGLNGLSSYITISVALALSISAFNAGNTQIAIFLVLIIFSVLGFMILNFPLGKIF